MLKRIFSAAIGTVILMTPAMRAEADIHAVLGIAGGAIIACGVTGACGNGGGNSGSGGGSTCGPQCQTNLEAQRALAFFGYNPGGADGVWGQNSSRAARAYETEMGFYPVDGQLNDAEHAFLVSSHQRAESGYYGPHQQAYVQGGPRALLASFNDERLGRFVAPGTTQPAAPGTTVVEATPEAPSFSGFTLAASMTEYCANVNAAPVGGETILISTNSDEILGQQFCLARDATQQDGALLRASISGLTPDQVVAQCVGLASILRPTMDALGAQPRENAEIAARGASASMPQDQAITAGRICLSVGYEQDNANVALASALLLSAQGEASYGELVGHHLRQGFGTTADAARAQEWLLSTADQIDAGASAGFLADEASGRAAIIRAAFGGSATQTIVEEAAQEAATLPTFTLGGGEDSGK